MNNNFLGMLVIPEEKTSLWRMYFAPRNTHAHTHFFFFFFRALIKKNLLLQSTERRASGVSPSLFLNTHREKLCTLSNTAYNAQRFVPNKTSGSQVPLRDVEGRWRQAMELALLWGNHLQRQAKTYQQPWHHRSSWDWLLCVDLSVSESKVWCVYTASVV